MSESRAIEWHRASYCGMSTCVEVAMIGAQVAVRDSKAPDQGALRYSRQEWQAFIEGVKAGEFDGFGQG